MPFTLSNYFEDFKITFSKINKSHLDNGINLVKTTIKNNKKVITCGNGGSSHTASHYITDWNKSYNLNFGKTFKGISLCDNQGLITAFGNDLSYEDVFSGQLKAIGEPGDLLIVVSGSGNSKNVIKALITAKEMGMISLGFLGYDGGECINLTDYSVLVPSFDMQICEDIHLMFGHIIMRSICCS